MSLRNKWRNRERGGWLATAVGVFLALLAFEALKVAIFTIFVL